MFVAELRDVSFGKRDVLNRLVRDSGFLAGAVSEGLPDVEKVGEGFEEWRGRVYGSKLFDRFLWSLFSGVDPVRVARDNGLVVSEQSVLLTFNRVRSEFLEWWNGSGERPRYDVDSHSWVVFGESQIRAGKWLYRYGDGFFVKVPVGGLGRSDREVFRVVPGRCEARSLQMLVDKEVVHGDACLVKKGEEWFLNFDVLG